MTNIRIIEKVGNNPGKTTIMITGVHGNEKVNVKLFDRIIPELRIDNGRVVFLYANLEAIEQNKRFIDINLNRAFIRELLDDEDNKLLEVQTAREIIPYLDNADYLLDLHSSNSPDSKPFVICEPQSFGLAKSMPCGLITFNWDEFEPGSTEYWMNLQNKVAMGFEGGYLGDSASGLRAEEALMNFLSLTGNINCAIRRVPNKKFLRIVSLYKNKESSFGKSREFADFEKLKEKTLIGTEGNKKVYADKGNILLFVRDREELDQECFLIAEEIDKENLLNIKEQDNLFKGGK